MCGDGCMYVTSHRRSWRLSGPFRESHASFSVEAYLVVRKNVHQYIGMLLHKRKSGRELRRLR